MKKKFWIFLSGILILLLGIYIGGGFQSLSYNDSVLKAEPNNSYQFSSESDLLNFNEAFISVAERANPSVVTIFTEKIIKRQAMQSPFGEDDRFRDFFDRFFRIPIPEGELRQSGLGSGVVIREDGYIITNNHVIEKADDIKVKLMGDKRYTAKIVGTDSKTDIAVLKIDEENLPVIPIGDSDKLRVGEWVLAIGSPFAKELAHTVTAGIVSAKGRSNFRLTEFEDFIQTDAAINPGNSGGALVNLKGELVGINSAIISGSRGFQGVGLAVPINMAKMVMEQLIKSGKVVRGFLGIIIQNIDEVKADALNLPDQRGVLVGDVNEDSPAEKAGLKVGDVIKKLNGEIVNNKNELRNNIAATSPGTWVTLGIIRDDEEESIRIKLGELPEDDVVSSPVEKKEDVIGIAVSEIAPSLALRFQIDPDERGILITDIDPSGVGADAGLKVGDIIKRINRSNIRSVSDYELTIKSLKGGDSVIMHIKRRDGSFFVSFRIPK